jgi:hypothetical protein
MLGEVPVDVFVDNRAGLIGADGERCGCGWRIGGTHGGGDGGGKNARQGEQALGNFHGEVAE